MEVVSWHSGSIHAVGVSVVRNAWQFCPRQIQHAEFNRIGPSLCARGPGTEGHEAAIRPVDGPRPYPAFLGESVNQARPGLPDLWHGFPQKENARIATPGDHVCSG